ncbi:hypothetical protein MUK42_29662 [Musa troglodytarum]|uniref:Uncharacterized protein n=1 Tax=Musa troglodytarum TaxID=320322 RepID=A0A9E7JWC8_9LILI|nr:hypothetical protein MUK42_29662 [Musa troglodytarum]
MGSLLENRFFAAVPYKNDLPISQAKQQNTHLMGLRKRISSFSGKIQSSSSSASTLWAFRKSASMPSIGEFAGRPLRRWWDSWCGWILSRKPVFAGDMEMNEVETAVLGWGSNGSWRHIFCTVRSEIGKLMRPNVLPTTQPRRHDSFSHARNFDAGKLRSVDD